MGQSSKTNKTKKGSRARSLGPRVLSEICETRRPSSLTPRTAYDLRFDATGRRRLLRLTKRPPNRGAAGHSGGLIFVEFQQGDRERKGLMVIQKDFQNTLGTCYNVGDGTKTRKKDDRALVGIIANGRTFINREGLAASRIRPFSHALSGTFQSPLGRG